MLMSSRERVGGHKLYRAHRVNPSVHGLMSLQMRVHTIACVRAPPFLIDLLFVCRWEVAYCLSRSPGDHTIGEETLLTGSGRTFKASFCGQVTSLR